MYYKINSTPWICSYLQPIPTVWKKKRRAILLFENCSCIILMKNLLLFLCWNLKLIFEFGDQLPETDEFGVGYFIGKQSTKHWLVTKKDLASMYPTCTNTSQHCHGCQAELSLAALSRHVGQRAMVNEPKVIGWVQKVRWWFMGHRLRMMIYAVHYWQ